jgi:DNA-binding CsgD family transcriptional regulator
MEQHGLSDRQIECLQLVAEGIESSKAIAHRVGLSPVSVDNYLSRAAKTLGAANRREAAEKYRQLRACKNNSISRSVSRFSRLAGSFRISLDWLAAGIRWLFSVPPIGGREHNLNRVEIVILILKIAAVSFSVLLALVLLGAGLLWVLR